MFGFNIYTKVQLGYKHSHEGIRIILHAIVLLKEKEWGGEGRKVSIGLTYYWFTKDVFVRIRVQKLLPFQNTRVHPRFLVGFRFTQSLVLCVL